VVGHIPTSLWHRNLFPIGRLDKDTTGLLLFATDGAISQLLLHPRRHVEKAYIATLKAPLPEGVEAIFKKGVPLTDGSVCLPAKLERVEETRVRVVVTEGRYHQVKRMLGHVGGFVIGLHRERLGPLLLDPELKPGQVRPLTPQERDTLVKAARGRNNQRPRPARPSRSPRTIRAGRGDAAKSAPAVRKRSRRKR
jgi:16S rRNA pseudouridine516 synthase